MEFCLRSSIVKYLFVQITERLFKTKTVITVVQNLKEQAVPCVDLAANMIQKDLCAYKKLNLRRLNLLLSRSQKEEQDIKKQ